MGVFSGRPKNTRRSLLKNWLGNKVIFEESHLDLGLSFRYRWAHSDRFGWVRTSTLTNDEGPERQTIDVVDGLADIMPWGIGVALQQQLSNLANAYRRTEITESGLGIFSLESLIVDRPEPAEALRATTVWYCGLDGVLLGVDPSALERARRSHVFEECSHRTGRPGSFLVNVTVGLDPGQSQSWHIVADVAKTQSEVAQLDSILRSDDDIEQLLEDDITRSSARLVEIVGSADGLQCTGSEKTDVHHLANTMFNVMRGGIFANGYSVQAERFSTFVAERNGDVANQHSAWIDDLPESIDVQDLRLQASELGDPNLTRLAHEYLPLSFSRRHGDPSRPWNQFDIRVQDKDGQPLLSYQGNWRDIFQNWEALCRSYPAFLPSIVAKFLNASTADGYNPYRITSEGIDWEVPEPENPWSGIGYWGDHQIVYLHRLLAAQEAHNPGWLAGELGRQVFSYANVPYRLVPFEQLASNPKATIEFDLEAEIASAERVSAIGADGKLLADERGEILHVNMLEKLLVPALAKLSNLVPRGGIWMNTQRPEWNDANNALVGHGLSMVTLAYLRRYVEMLADLADDMAESHLVSSEVIEWAEAVTGVLESNSGIIGAQTVGDGDRARMLSELGLAYGRYRSSVYSHGPTGPRPLDPETLRRLLRVALVHLDDAVAAARRPDGLYHSYNILRLSEDGREAAVEHLPEMLEGQVAAISSGLLGIEEIAALVEVMFESDLHRSDVDSFMLYPARVRPPFLDRNRVPAAQVAANPLLVTLLEVGSDDVIVIDADGQHRFNADFHNVGDLDEALKGLPEALQPMVKQNRTATRHLFESVFNHHDFTGRSSTMYAFEGIGSIYWHMVAKLLVAVQETMLRDADQADLANVQKLRGLYDRVRNGLGFNKTALEYGAFPTDPYSHTPAHAGAQQPGMTGQVKEELLTRWAELGVTVSGGCIHMSPLFISQQELRDDPGELSYVDHSNQLRHLRIDAGAAGFTLCQVPVVISPTSSDSARMLVKYVDGSEEQLAGWSLPQSISQNIFSRSGQIEQLQVHLPLAAVR